MSDWKGTDEMFAFMDRVETAADDSCKELVAVSSTRLVRKSQGNFQGSHARGEPHVGGDRPNIVSGNLRRSIKADPITRFKKADYGTSVGPRLIYGRRVELGFRGSPTYPYFEPAVRELAPDYERDAERIWNKNLSAV